MSVLHLLFSYISYELFDANGDGTVDVTELAAGITVLCGGTRDDKARAVFDLYDANKDGVLSVDELTSCVLILCGCGSLPLLFDHTRACAS